MNKIPFVNMDNIPFCKLFKKLRIKTRPSIYNISSIPCLAKIDFILSMTAELLKSFKTETLMELDWESAKTI